MAAPPPPDPDFDPTVELGTPSAGIAPWSAFYDSTEDVAELAWPRSIQVYNKMRNDEQIAALYLAFVLPIQGYQWYIKPNGARDETVEHVARDYGLPVEGQDDDQPSGRLRDRFDFGDYLSHSMLKLLMGFMMFEQVYRLGTDNRYHVRKYAPRLPGSIQQIQAARDGGLLFIRQYPANDGLGAFLPSGQHSALDLLGGNPNAPTIEVDRLIAHVCDKEGANWYGRPWTRAIYRNWLIKDRLLRVDALKHERNGMGVPTGKTQQGVTQKALDKLLGVVKAWKAGENSAAVLPPGTDIELKGVQGSLPDTLASIKYHDEQMARRWLAMFMPLGSTESGSRALGETFVDFFGLAQEAVAKDFAKTTNKYGVEDLIDVNYSIDENAPLLAFRAESDRGLATSDLIGLIQCGAITVDPELESYLRAQHDYPAKTQEEPAADPVPTDRQQARARIKAAVSQREPSDVEKQSKVDFAGLKAEFDAALDQLVATWNSDIKLGQIDELVALIGGLNSDDLEGLANIEASPVGSNVIDDAAGAMAALAEARARNEMADQGVELSGTDLTDLTASLKRRAKALEALLARSISTAAADRALSQAGGELTSTEIAQDVGAHLRSLTDAYLTTEFAGALMHAQNGARRAVFDRVDNKTIHASERLDTHTCDECLAIDGHKYASMADAEYDYATGGYRDCAGGYRCRGFLIAVVE